MNSKFSTKLLHLPLAISLITGSAWLVSGCSPKAPTAATDEVVTEQTEIKQKAVVYQIFTRLFGNQNTTNKLVSISWMKYSSKTILVGQ